MNLRKKGGENMSNFEFRYAMRSLMTGSYQNDIDVQLHRASIIENRINKRSKDNDRRQK